jgi:hypothetical protein
VVLLGRRSCSKQFGNDYERNSLLMVNMTLRLSVGEISVTPVSPVLTCTLTLLFRQVAFSFIPGDSLSVAPALPARYKTGSCKQQQVSTKSAT